MSRQNTDPKPLTVVIIIISIMLIGGLVRNAISLRQARERVKLVQSQVEELEKKKAQVEKEVAAQTDEAALDQAIRNKLNLAKPGEKLVVITGPDSGQLPPQSSSKNPAALPPVHQWWQVLNPPKS